MSFSDNRDRHEGAYRDVLGRPVEPRPRTAAEVLADLRGFMRERARLREAREARRPAVPK